MMEFCTFSHGSTDSCTHIAVTNHLFYMEGEKAASEEVGMGQPRVFSARPPIDVRTLGLS